MGFPPLGDDNASASLELSLLPYRQLKPYATRNSLTRSLIPLLGFLYSEAKCLHIPLMGFFPLGDGNARASLRVHSQLAYGQSKPSAVGFLPLRVQLRFIAPLMGFSSLGDDSESNSAAGIFSMLDNKSLQVSLMGSLPLENNNANSLTHFISNHPYQR